MSRINKGLRTVFSACCLVIISMMFVSGCGRVESSSEEPKTFIDISDDGKILQANFDKTEVGTMGASGIEIKEGEYLVLDSEITEGSVNVEVYRGGDDINTLPLGETEDTIAYTFDRKGITEYGEIQPGSYMVKVEVSEKATGSMTFLVEPL